MKFYLLPLLTIAANCPVQAQSVLQISSGTSFTIKANEQVSFNGLVLAPTSDFTMQDNTITKNAAITNPASNPAAAMQRVYKFLNNTAPFTGSVRLYYLDAELGTADESSLVVNVHNGSAWDNIATSSRDVASNYIQSQQGSFTALNEIAVTSGNTVLPLHWGDVSASADNNGAAVRFTCYAITAVDQFQVQRSTDGRHWNTINSIGAPFNSTQSFLLTDRAVPEGKVFYRIMAVDMDGRSSYSGVVLLNGNQTAGSIQLLANPSQHAFILKSSNRASAIIRTVLLNASGQQLKSWAGSQTSFDIHDLPAGFYIIKVSLNTGKDVVLRLVK